MSLTLTASYVSTNESTYATKHGYMLLALDELLNARFSGKTPLAFSATPDFPLGDRYSFGTPSNLTPIAGPYTAASESIGSPAVVTTYAAGQVALVTGGNSFRSLNRKQINYSGSDWWLDFTGNDPERFERLALADIAVENYTDPVAGNNTTFTFRSHWSRHGCIRIHNGNRFNLDVKIHAYNTTQSVTVAPYGILTGRRLHQTGSFSFDGTYLHITKAGDRMSFQRNDDGQSAANMETAYEILSTTNWLRFYKPESDYDTTSRETASFTGTNPAESNYFYDWINSRGTFLSVLTDLNTNTVLQTEVYFGGLSAGFTTTDYVTVNYYVGSTVARFQSTVIYPHNNYTHVLVPLTSNFTNGQIIDIKGAGTDVALPSIQLWGHLQNTFPFSRMVKTDNDYYPPDYNGDTITYPTFDYTSPVIDTTNWNKYNKLVSDVFPTQTNPSEFTVTSTFLKTNGALGRQYDLTLNTASVQYADFDLDLLENLKLDAMPKWTFLSSYGLHSSRLRFVPFAYRKYQPAGSLVGGDASYTSHPEDNDLQGTPDKSGSQQSLNVFASTVTSLRIEGQDFTRYADGVGMDLYLPTSNLWYVVNKLQTEPNWWLTNDYNNFTETQKLLTWRLPRLVEHLNDLVKAINNVAEVYPVDVRDLYKNPLPSNCFELPFTLNNDPAYAVPTDWVAGRTEGGSGGNTLTDWATIWGVTVSNINAEIQALQSHEKYIWILWKANRTSSPPYGLYTYAVEKIKYTSWSPSSEGETNNYNGVTFGKDKAIEPNDFARLFGGCSPYNTYRYIKKNDMASAFSSLGVNIPTVPIGERFTPTYYEDTSLTKVGGTYFGNESDPSHQRTWLDWVAHLFYKNNAGAGSTWRRRIRDGEVFRIIKDNSTAKRRYYLPQQTSGLSTYEWFVHETSEDATSITDNTFSDRTMCPQTASAVDSFGVMTTAEAYPTVTEIHGDYGVLLLAGPEPTFQFSWKNPIPAYDYVTPYHEVTTTTSSGNLFVKEVAAADMPITVDKIKIWSGIDHDTWHVQVIERNGILRV